MRSSRDLGDISARCALAAVSDYAIDTLALQFGRRAMLIPNAIDCQLFYPPIGAAGGPRDDSGAPPLSGRVLLVGNPLQAPHRCCCYAAEPTSPLTPMTATVFARAR